MDTYKKNKIKSIAAWTVAFLLAIFWALVAILPFFFMVLNSLKEKFEMLVKGVFEFPETPYWSNYVEVLTGGCIKY